MLRFLDNPATQIVNDLAFDEYLARPGISQSLLKVFDYDSGGCPALYRHQVLNGSGKKPTAALEHGRHYHQFLLEPDSFDRLYAICTEEKQLEILTLAITAGSKAKVFSTRLNEYSKWRDDQEAAGRSVILRSDADVLHAMRDAIFANSEVAEWFSWKGAMLEQSMFSGWQNREGDGFQLKSRIDINPPDSYALLDLKTARTAHPDEFARSAWKLGYHIQAAFYIDRARANGQDKRRFGFLAQDKFPPYLACIHWMGEEWIKYGRIRYTKILLDIADAVKRNDWPGYRTGELMPPSWAQTEIESVAA
jgi:hypothetical protein